ncbi:glycosyltransferase [Microbacterium kunmingense]|uniref:glycosyltransferase n=1 Tax=Microbacterium kunmingense TaxID=2915939 RepID=UPI002003FB9F|nr:glycosyltransferase [Microbacterium kunmingense]
MRVAVIAESFLPHMNGVTGSVLQILHHLSAAGHETLVIAPSAGGASDEMVVAGLWGADARLLRSVPLPSYPEVRVVFARVARLAGILRTFRPDVVHLASPFVLGWQGVVAAEAVGVPTVAIYQTDVVAYTEKYGMPRATALVRSHVTRLHRRVTLTLAPSTASMTQLAELGVDRVRRWGRGVDTDLFHPSRRSESWRAEVAPGRTIVGYVGRLAPEKQVADLRVLHDLPGTSVVIVGDGPSREALQKSLPEAVFTGHLRGVELARALASFDVFVHPGESETFGQTIQEALASGVPVVATGTGGPVDLVRSSVDGWLYRPGDLDDLRTRVADLVGDGAKRAAFAAAAGEAVRTRSWEALCAQLVDHYDEARRLHPIDAAQVVRGLGRPDTSPAPLVASPGWRRFVALGDSLTEGLCDVSRMPSGQFRGWADRLAELLARSRSAGASEPLQYANLAVRSRRVRDLTSVQVPQALALKPELVSILIGANDLVGGRSDPAVLADEVAAAVRRLRDAGIDVLLVTPFLPRRPGARVFSRRFARYAEEMRQVAGETGAMLLDLDAHPAIGDVSFWADDRVHLRSSGHRFLAYRAAETLGVPDAEALGRLDAALHADDDPPAVGSWLRRDALPWIWRRLRGRTAGDGVSAKHADYVLVGGGGAAPARLIDSP